MIEMVPAIIPESFDHLAATLARLKGCASTVQIDVTDGLFVPHRSWPFNRSDREHFERLVRGQEGMPYWEDFNFEVDLMAHQPERVIRDWVAVGVSRAVFHMESQHDFSALRHGADTLELGIAVPCDVDPARIDPYRHSIDYIQVMGIATIGRQGEPFSEHTLTTVRDIRARFPDVIIQVDGGVRESSARLLVEAGATRLVAGSFILRAEDPAAALEALRHADLPH